MKASEIVIDFINQLFMVGLICFVLIFIILGDRLGAAYAIMQALSPFGFFGLFFMIKFKFSREKVRKMRSEDRLNEVLFYLTDKDISWDWFFIIIIPVLIFIFPFFFTDLNSFDLIQFLLVFSAFAFIHKIVFKKDQYGERQYLTRLDETIDEIVLFFLPILVYGIAFFIYTVNVLDIVQSVLVLILFYLWHFFFFKLYRR